MPAVLPAIRNVFKHAFFRAHRLTFYQACFLARKPTFFSACFHAILLAIARVGLSAPEGYGYAEDRPFRVCLRADFLARRIIVLPASLPEGKRAGLLASRISGFPSFLLTCFGDGKTPGKK
jgi:hypothetical protein